MTAIVEPDSSRDDPPLNSIPIYLERTHTPTGNPRGRQILEILGRICAHQQQKCNPMATAAVSYMYTSCASGGLPER